MPVANEFELLCERCGYSIEGLDPAGHCPECGSPIAGSLPQRRAGTPAQRSTAPGKLLRPGPLLRTVWRAVRSPRKMWDVARVGDAADAQILAMLLIAASLLLTAQPVARCVEMVRGDWHFSTTEERVVGVVVAALLLPTSMGAAMITLAVLTALEWWGIQLFARLHGRRITPAIATTIVSHASAGWLVGAALLTPAWLLGRALAAAADHIAILRWELVFVLPTLLPAAAALLGLLLFELITYSGVLRLRYANRERPADDTSGAMSPHPQDPYAISEKPE